jgi:uncharacterized protein (DUF2062 family)
MYERHAGVREWLYWLLSDAAPSLLVGLLLISVVTAAIGYLVAVWVWRGWIGRKHRARLARPTRAPVLRRVVA